LVLVRSLAFFASSVLLHFHSGFFVGCWQLLNDDIVRPFPLCPFLLCSTNELADSDVDVMSTISWIGQHPVKERLSVCVYDGGGGRDVLDPMGANARSSETREREATHLAGPLPHTSIDLTDPRVGQERTKRTTYGLLVHQVSTSRTCEQVV